MRARWIMRAPITYASVAFMTSNALSDSDCFFMSRSVVRFYDAQIHVP